jgi:Sec-independent protein translocase protein TatA
VTGWIALALIVAVVGATAAIFAAGRKAGAATEAAKAQRAELKSQKEASDAKDRMLEAGAAAPRDRDALTERLRGGTF